MRSKLFIVLLFSVLFLSFTTAIKQGDFIELTQSCSDCTYMNLTKVAYPNGTYAVRGDFPMDNIGGEYNYTWTDTEAIGIYEWCYEGDVDGETNVPACLKFSVTRQGFDLSEGQGNIYVFLMILVFLLFIVTLYFGIGIPWKYPRDANGSIVGVDYKKYLKIGLLFVSYLILIFFFAIGKGMSYAYLDSTEIYGFFNVGFSILIAVAFPVFILMAAFTIIGALADKKVQRAVERGVPIR